MKKKNGEVKLPPGFRFHPTDEELVVQYLKRKVFSFPLPASIIPELHHLSNSDPWDLPGDLGEERYFFSTKEAKYPNGNRSNRATNSGYWKATGLDKQILNSNSNVVVGMKKTLVFYKGKPPHGSRTDWIMHEYRLTNHSSSLKQNWVVCRIFLKKRGGAKNGGGRGGENTVTVREKPSKVKNSNSNSNSKVVVFYDFLSSPILSATSGITEEHNENENENEHEDSSSSFPSLTNNN